MLLVRQSPSKTKIHMLTQPQDNILQSYLCSALVVFLQPGLWWPCTASRLPNKVLPTVPHCLQLPQSFLKDINLNLKKITSPVHRLFLISYSIESINSVSHRPDDQHSTLQLHLSWKPYSIYSVLRDFLLLFFLGKTFVLKCFIFCTFICNISCK